MRTIWDTVFSRCEVASSINSLSLRINKVTPIHACKRSSIFRSQASRRLLKVIQFSAFWSGIIIWSFLWRFFFLHAFDRTFRLLNCARLRDRRGKKTRVFSFFFTVTSFFHLREINNYFPFISSVKVRHARVSARISWRRFALALSDKRFDSEIHKLIM